MDISATIEELLANPKGVRFADLARICDYFFGEPRQQGQATGSTGLRGGATPEITYKTARAWRSRIKCAKSSKPLKGYKQMMTDHYTYRLTWSVEDEEYVGLCAEFPSLSWLSSTQEEAFSGIRRLVSESIADMQANNERPPEPLADRSYSGKFMVRVPPETHRALAMRAAEEGVSLNRLVSARLANDAA